MTAGRRKPFRYPLEALLVQRRWDVDALSQELATARQALAACEQEAGRLAAIMVAANDAVKRLRTNGAALDLSREQLLAGYRDRQEELLVDKQAEAARGLALCEQIAEDLARSRRALQGYEDHRADLLGQHRHAADSAAAKAADDAWLARQLVVGVRP